VALDLRPWLAGLRLHWPWVMVGVLSVGSYPLLAFLEGFLAAARTGKSAAGRAVGQVVGGTSALTVAIPTAVLMLTLRRD
jgi:hypothetical protein